VITVLVHRQGRSERVASIDRAWLQPDAGAFVWVDLSAPSVPESLILTDTFAFHPLSVEDAMSALQYPKIELYESYLYVVLHGILFEGGEHCFRTHDVDFFVGPTYLVTVHNGASRSIAELCEQAARNGNVLSEGPVALFHRIVDRMVAHYRPEVDKLEARLDDLEQAIFDQPEAGLSRALLLEKRQVAELRRVITPQRDIIARIARRDFAAVSTEMSFRFRDVYDQLVRIADDALVFQDRITGMLDAHLSNVSNRLNEVMKVLTVVSVIFMPLTLLTGIFGMNVPLPHFPGGDQAQFWWLAAIFLAVIVVMLTLFRRRRWM
jgi:magnesium transporter